MNKFNLQRLRQSNVRKLILAYSNELIYQDEIRAALRHNADFQIDDNSGEVCFNKSITNATDRLKSGTVKLINLEPVLSGVSPPNDMFTLNSAYNPFSRMCSVFSYGCDQIVIETIADEQDICSTCSRFICTLH